MALDVHVPVVLPLDSADYISQYGTATVFLEYGTATPPADGTATTAVVSGTEQYEFWVSTPVNSYFRYRVGESDASDATSYSPTWQQPQAYATLQEVVRAMDFPDTSRYDELEALLVEATDHITNAVCGGRSFKRDPIGSGETTKTLNVMVSGQDRLSLARSADLDIISLSSVKVAAATGESYDTLAAGSTGYYLLPDDPGARPYSDLALSDIGTAHTSFPTGWATVQLTGVFGWATVPDLVRRATVDLVRYWWNSRQADGQPVGMSAFGSPIFGSGLPKTVRDLGRSDYAWKTWVD